eukprot:2968979-Alexandrium_andersonii.AAC.1
MKSVRDASCHVRLGHARVLLSPFVLPDRVKVVRVCFRMAPLRYPWPLCAMAVIPISRLRGSGRRTRMPLP